MLTKLEIENFKSIHKESIDLGRVNVFIGINGCGKTNVLEALGMASAALDGFIKNDELALKGIRVTKPSITFSSFLGKKTNHNLKLNLYLNKIKKPILFDLSSETNTINNVWYDCNIKFTEYLEAIIPIALDENKNSTFSQMTSLKPTIDRLKSQLNIEESDAKNILSDILTGLMKSETGLSLMDKASMRQDLREIDEYKIFNLSTQILRGIGLPSYSIPGIHGENLDSLINSFSKEEMEELEQNSYFISWLDEILIDKDDNLKLQGHKLNLSQSKLYFRDKFMQKKNNVFSAENANEGILHALFYLSLFISKKTPKLFAIDNIETALNPGLCRDLIEVLIKLAKKNDKQVLITTHNPAILDGINLHDEEQRIFTVSRNNRGHTRVKRLQMKPDAKLNGRTLKLSEIWMRNYIGAIPQHY